MLLPSYLVCLRDRSAWSVIASLFLITGRWYEQIQMMGSERLGFKGSRWLLSGNDMVYDEHLLKLSGLLEEPIVIYLLSHAKVEGSGTRPSLAERRDALFPARRLRTSYRGKS